MTARSVGESDATPLTVHARAPLRVDLAGGGMDLPAFAGTEGAASLVAAVSPAAHVEVTLGGRTIRLRAEDQEERVTVRTPAELSYDGTLDRAKAALNMLPVTGGIEILTRVDTPPGAGLGAEAALSVALLAALARCRREEYDADELADFACELERAELKGVLGRHDAYVAAHGGIHLVAEGPAGWSVRAVAASAERLAELAAHLLVVPVGRAYASGVATADVAAASRAGDPAVMAAIRALRDGAALAVPMIEAGEWRELAGVFDQAWQHQRRLDPLLSAPPMRALESAARGAGAWGLKVTGTQSGASLAVLCPPAARGSVVGAVESGGETVIPYRFHPAGVHAWVQAAPHGTPS